jgi:hypothetical protein
MKIKKVQLSEKDKRKAYRTAVRKVSQEAGLDKVTRPRIYKNRKKYTRKGKSQIIRKEIEQTGPSVNKLPGGQF